MALSAVIFDLGKVLVDWDISGGLWAEFIGVLGPKAEDTPRRRQWHELYSGFATGRVKPDAFHEGFVRITGIKLAFDEFDRQWCDIFHPMQGTERLLRDCLERIPVGLLSDTDPLHWRYLLRQYPWLSLIENPTLSFDIGATKPDPETYRAAAKNTGFPASQCFFVDDREQNVQGALEAGMDSIVFPGVEALRQALVDRGVLP
jgi:putative hydrolase of the HAD superfamily